MPAKVIRRPFALVMALLSVSVVACAPAAPPSPTPAPAQPAAGAAPAKPTEGPAAKPAEAKPAASPAAKAESKPAEAKPKPAEAKPAAKAAVTLRGVSSWERPISYNQPFLRLIERVSQKTNGELQISYAGPEVVPAFEAVTAVSRGAFDFAHSTGSFYATQVPEANAVNFLVGPCSRYRQAGALDVLDQVHRARSNVTFLGCSGGGAGFVFLTRDPVQSLDYFRGKKMRSHPLYGPILTELGAATIEIPPAEVYTALERRVADGVAWPENGILERKLEEVVKYMIRPPWLEVKLDYVMNVDALNRLPQHLQRALLETIHEAEDEADEYFRAATRQEHAELQRRGMQLMDLPQGEADKLMRTVNDVVWANIIKDSPEWGPRLREAFAKVPR